MCLKDGETVTVCVTLGERETGGGDFPLWSAALETVDFWRDRDVSKRRRNPRGEVPLSLAKLENNCILCISTLPALHLRSACTVRTEADSSLLSTPLEMNVAEMSGKSKTTALCSNAVETAESELRELRFSQS